MNLTQKPSTELVASLIFNHEENLLRAQADISISSSNILEANTSAPFIKKDDSSTTTWSKMGAKFTTTTKNGLVTFSLPEFNHSWGFHVDERSESSSTYDHWPRERPSWRIRNNHEIQ
jgi:hypothetical protein